MRWRTRGRPRCARRSRRWPGWSSWSAKIAPHCSAAVRIRPAMPDSCGAIYGTCGRACAPQSTRWLRPLELDRAAAFVRSDALRGCDVRRSARLLAMLGPTAPCASHSRRRSGQPQEGRLADWRGLQAARRPEATPTRPAPPRVQTVSRLRPGWLRAKRNGWLGAKD